MIEQNKLKSLDVKLIDEVFEMGDGYVLDFSNKTFFEFFYEELNINIDDPAFEIDGSSKAKRLRCYLRQARNDQVVKTIIGLWEYREAMRRRSKIKELLPEIQSELFQLIVRLGGNPPEHIKQQSVKSEPSRLSGDVSKVLLDKLIEVSRLDPQPRGFAFEKFLKDLFDSNGMEGRASFRVVGEQIDGSFDLNGETYLLEAKWTGLQVGAACLRSFNAKVEDKASWSRGLFISDSGFSEEGLVAFGKGKSVVCMDGLDLCEMLQRQLTFGEVLSKKVRRAAEIGRPFVRVRELF